MEYLVAGDLSQMSAGENPQVFIPVKLAKLANSVIRSSRFVLRVP